MINRFIFSVGDGEGDGYENPTASDIDSADSGPQTSQGKSQFQYCLL